MEAKTCSQCESGKDVQTYVDKKIGAVVLCKACAQHVGYAR